ncbi:MAG: hypothetical protein LBS36_13705 [Oscillospiraceae bacterium]|nr:hypothetical protein [Oscillospiraceae bacterium]
MIQINKISLSIDLDDTLSCFNEHWISIYNQKSGDNISIDKITDWTLTQFVLPEWEDKIFSREIVYSKDFFLNVPIKEDAVDFMKWACEKYDVSIVSASYFETVPDKAKWIIKHFPFFDIRNFIPCYYKYKIGADIMIDDGVHNFNRFEGKKYLIDRPWNKKFKEYDNIRYNKLTDISKCMDNLLYFG